MIDNNKTAITVLHTTSFVVVVLDRAAARVGGVAVAAGDGDGSCVAAALSTLRADAAFKPSTSSTWLVSAFVDSSLFAGDDCGDGTADASAAPPPPSSSSSAGDTGGDGDDGDDGAAVPEVEDELLRRLSTVTNGKISEFVDSHRGHFQFTEVRAYRRLSSLL